MRTTDVEVVDESDRDGVATQNEDGQISAAGQGAQASQGESSKKKGKRKRKEISKSVTRSGWENPDESKWKPPHPGSYAAKEMREKFNVDLPETFLGNEKDTEQRTKKKVAFLLGYLGTNYAGFQINEGQRTLSAEMELALLRCRLLDVRNFGYPTKYSWSISGRTDKGVHACAQVCSAIIELVQDESGDPMEHVRTVLNEELPDDIRVLDVLRTTKSFCAKTQRDRVRYQYMVPSFLLMKPRDIQKVFDQHAPMNDKRLPANPLTNTEISKIQEAIRGFRADKDTLVSLETSLDMYKGTHFFHNFTKGVRASEDRSRRFIEYFRVEEPIVFDNGCEWIPTQVLGQSFMLHQIRRMICMAVEVTRGAATRDVLETAMSRQNETIQVGLAPPHGLYLDMSYYGGYNRRKQKNPELKDIEWHEEGSAAHQRWKSFRNSVVMRHVVTQEEQEGNFVRFLYAQEYFFDQSIAYDPARPKAHSCSKWQSVGGEGSNEKSNGE